MIDNKWVYGSLVQFLDGSVGICNGDDFEHYKINAVKSSTIGQFTDMVDYYGRVIYEGDILDVYIPCNSVGKEEHRTRVVVWESEMSRYEIQDENGNCIADAVGARCGEVHYKVIGNVHDNPELLEKGGGK